MDLALLYNNKGCNSLAAMMGNECQQSISLRNVSLYIITAERMGNNVAVVVALSCLYIILLYTYAKEMRDVEASCSCWAIKHL